jgi:diacylglycerol O-acyltransferase / wax synthase
MQQLTGTDDLFLTMETDSVFGHVSSLSILEASEAPVPITRERVKEVFSSRLHLLPMFRRRVVEVPFALDHPFWVDDPDFDIDKHIHQVTLRAPGGMRQLKRQAAKIVSVPLPRDRPLWRTTVIRGIEGGRVGLLTQVHHAAVDGIAGNDVLTALLDATPELRDVGMPPPWQPEPMPSPIDLLRIASVSIACRPLRFVELQWQLYDAFAGAMARPRNDRPLARALSRTATVPPTPFNHTISADRSWAFERLPLDGFKEVKNTFGCTVNDVVLAVSAGALRRWLIDHDALPAAPLVAGVPLSLRDADDHDFGNRATMLTATLPTHLPDPVDRLQAAHEGMADAKGVTQAVPASILADWAEFATPGLASLAAREAAALHLADWTNPPYNVVVSNVPGPSYTLYFAGAPLVGIYPLSAVADGQGLNITLLGYRDGLHFGLLACPELVPDLDDLAGYLRAELALLVACARQLAPPAPVARARGKHKTGAVKKSKAVNGTSVNGTNTNGAGVNGSRRQAAATTAA